MIKLDEKIVKNILGTIEVKEIISNLKCCRYYHKGTGKVEDSVLILTPMLQSDGEFLKSLVDAQKIAGHPVEYTERKVGKNYVYTFKEQSTS